MAAAHGVGSRIRDLFASSFRKKGSTPLLNNMRIYRKGDYLDFKANGPAHEGTHPEFYQGRTGRVWKVTKRAMGIEINAQKWWFRIDPRSRSGSTRLVYRRADLNPTANVNSQHSGQLGPIASPPTSVHQRDAGARKRKSDIVWHCVQNGEAAQSRISSAADRKTTKNRVVVVGGF